MIAAIETWRPLQTNHYSLLFAHGISRFHKDVGLTGEQIAELVRKERIDELKKEAAELKKKKPQP